MSRCVRNGSSYKRHKIEGGKCVKCGAIAVPKEQYEQALQHAVNLAIQAQQNG